MAMRLFPLFPGPWPRSNPGPCLLLDVALKLTDEYFYSAKRFNRVTTRIEATLTRLRVPPPLSIDTLRKRLPGVIFALKGYLVRHEQPFYLADQARVGLGLDGLELPDACRPGQACAACAARPGEQHWGPLLGEHIKQGLQGQLPGNCYFIYNGCSP